MKIVRTFLLLVLFCPSCWAGVTNKNDTAVDLLIVAGQSNAVGFETSIQELPANPIDKQVLFWWRCGDPPADRFDSTSNHQWTYLKVQPNITQTIKENSRQLYRNFKNPGGGFGPEIGLARALMQQQRQQPLAIVKVAYNGTSVTRWQRPAVREFNCYQALVSETRAAIRKAAEKGISLQLRALIWVQGESDGNETYAHNYEKNLRAMIDSLHVDLAAPEFIVLLGFNTKFRHGSPAIQQVVRAQQNLAAKDKRITYVDSRHCELANGVHFSSRGTLELGRLFARNLLLTEKSLETR